MVLGCLNFTCLMHTLVTPPSRAAKKKKKPSMGAHFSLSFIIEGWNETMHYKILLSFRKVREKSHRIHSLGIKKEGKNCDVLHMPQHCSQEWSQTCVMVLKKTHHAIGILMTIFSLLHHCYFNSYGPSPVKLKIMMMEQTKNKGCSWTP